MRSRAFTLLALVVALATPATAEASGLGSNGLIAFTSNRDGDNEIYVMNADGSGQANRTNTPLASDRQPAFSPDARRIAFTSNRDGDDEIFVMNVDGSGVAQVTTDAGTDTDPEWTQDGSAILFASDRDGDFEVYSVAISAGGVVGATTKLTDNAFVDRHPEPWPDNGILFTSDRDGHDEVYFMTFAGAAEGLLGGVLSTFSDSQPDPRQNGFLFTSNRDGNNEIYSFAFPATQTNLTNDAGADTAAAFSPDGTQAVFVSTRGGTGDTEIWTMNANGTSQTQRTTNTASDSDPDWTTAGAPEDNWPSCGFGRAWYCITAFTVSVGGTAAGLAAPPANISPQVFAAAGLAQVQAVRNDIGGGIDRYDLVGGGGPLSTASLLHFELNIGAIDPALLHSAALIETWTTTTNAVTGNTMTLEIRPQPRSFLAPACPDFECGGVTSVATDDHLGVATAASGAFPDIPALPADMQAYYDAFRTASRTAWVATDAQVFGGPEFDFATGAFSFTAAAPHFMTDGSTLNPGYAVIFIPNSLLVFWGLDPATVAASSITITKTVNGITTSSSFTFAAVAGGVKLTIPDGSYTYSAPEFMIDAVAPAAPPAAPSAPAVSAAPTSIASDLSLAGSVVPTAATVGQDVTYSATVTNAGPGTATGVTVSATLPPGLSYVSATASQGSCYGGSGPVTCVLGQLAAGGSATVTVVAEATRVGTFATPLAVSATSSDPNGFNGTQTLETTVSEVPAITPPVAVPPAAPPQAQPPAAPTPPAAQPPASQPPKAQPKPAAKPKAKKKAKPAPKKKAAPKKKR